MIKKLMEFDVVEGIGIVLFCLLVIAFGPIAKLVLCRICLRTLQNI